MTEALLKYLLEEEEQFTKNLVAFRDVYVNMVERETVVPPDKQEELWSGFPKLLDGQQRFLTHFKECVDANKSAEGITKGYSRKVELLEAALCQYLGNLPRAVHSLLELSNNNQWKIYMESALNDSRAKGRDFHTFMIVPRGHIARLISILTPFEDQFASSSPNVIRLLEQLENRVRSSAGRGADPKSGLVVPGSNKLKLPVPDFVDRPTRRLLREGKFLMVPIGSGKGASKKKAKETGYWFCDDSLFWGNVKGPAKGVVRLMHASLQAERLDEGGFVIELNDTGIGQSVGLICMDDLAKSAWESELQDWTNYCIEFDKRARRDEALRVQQEAAERARQEAERIRALEQEKKRLEQERLEKAERAKQEELERPSRPAHEPMRPAAPLTAPMPLVTSDTKLPPLNVSPRGGGGGGPPPSSISPRAAPEPMVEHIPGRTSSVPTTPSAAGRGSPPAQRVSNTGTLQRSSPVVPQVQPQQSSPLPPSGNVAAIPGGLPPPGVSNNNMGTLNRNSPTPQVIPGSNSPVVGSAQPRPVVAPPRTVSRPPEPGTAGSPVVPGRNAGSGVIPPVNVASSPQVPRPSVNQSGSIPNVSPRSESPHPGPRLPMKRVEAPPPWEVNGPPPPLSPVSSEGHAPSPMSSSNGLSDPHPGPRLPMKRTEAPPPWETNNAGTSPTPSTPGAQAPHPGPRLPMKRTEAPPPWEVKK